MRTGLCLMAVIVAALAVAFLGQAAGADVPEKLLSYGGGVAVVIAALAFFMRQGDKADSPGNDK